MSLKKGDKVMNVRNPLGEYDLEFGVTYIVEEEAKFSPNVVYLRNQPFAYCTARLKKCNKWWKE